MTNDMLAQWLTLYQRLGAQSDIEWHRMEQYEKAGYCKRAQLAAEAAAGYEAERNGMLVALNIFGYDITLRDGEYKVILEDGKLLSVE